MNKFAPKMTCKVRTAVQGEGSPSSATVKNEGSNLPRASTLRPEWSFDGFGEREEERRRRRLYDFGTACPMGRIEYGA